MHQHSNHRPLGQTLLAIGMFGFAAAGCNEPASTGQTGTVEGNTPFHIEVPDTTVAVVAISKNGDMEVIAVDEGKGVKPSECDTEGPDPCDPELLERATTLEMGEAAPQPSATDRRAGDLAPRAATATRKCLFSYKVGNKIYYYKAPCTP